MASLSEATLSPLQAILHPASLCMRHKRQAIQQWMRKACPQLPVLQLWIVDAEISNASTSPKRETASVQEEDLPMQKKSPLALLPLDSTVSLPPKSSGLVLGSSTDDDSERIDTLQAYQPIREGQQPCLFLQVRSNAK